MRGVKIIIAFALALVTVTATAQTDQYVQPFRYPHNSFTQNVTIGVGTARKTDTSAYLEIGPNTAAKKGFLGPRLTTAERATIPSPRDGLQIYNKTTKRINYYDTSCLCWQEIGPQVASDTNYWRTNLNNFSVSPSWDPRLGTSSSTPLSIATNGTTRLVFKETGITNNDDDSIGILGINHTTKELVYKTGSLYSNAWSKTGNASTTPVTNFIGTTDAVSFGSKVNNKWASFHRYTLFNDTTTPTAPGGGFTTYGQGSGKWLIENLLNGGSTVGGYTGVYMGFLVGPRIGVILPTDFAGAAPSDENAFGGYQTGRWTRLRSQAYSKGRNVAWTYFGLFRNISGSYNNAFGAFPLELNNAGNGNNAFGDGGLRSNIDGDFNVTTGGSGMLNNSTGVYSFTIVSGGSTYSVGDTIYVSAPYSNGPGTCLATAWGLVTAVDGGGAITGTTVMHPGCGYSEDGGCFFVGNCHPAVTITGISGPGAGSGTGASLTAVLRSGTGNTGMGTLNGASQILSQYNIYAGYGAGNTTRYWDDHVYYFGNGSKITSTVFPYTKIENAMAFGREAEVEASNTSALGSTTYPYKWVINGSLGDSALKVNGGVRITGGLRVDALNHSVSSSGYAIPKVNSVGTFSNSAITQDFGADVIRIDDQVRGVTNTGSFRFIVRDSYAGDGTSNAASQVLFSTADAGSTQKYMLRMSATAMADGSKVSFSLGKTTSTGNIFYWTYHHAGTNSSSNFLEHQFQGVNNISRMYRSGNHTIGNSITTDNGYRLQVDRMTMMDTSLAVRLGVGTVAPVASALVEFTSTTKGFLVPRMNTTEQDAISSPATALLIFNTDSAMFRYWNGSAWTSIGAATGGGGGGGANTALSNLASVSINASMIPQTGLDLGAASTAWKDLYLYGSGSYGSHSLKLTGIPTGNRTVTIPDATTTVVGTDVTQTLTNKRWVPRVGSTSSSGTPTINTDNVDIYKLTAQAANITSFTTNLSGTPNDGDILEVQITDDGTPRTIAWGASFVSSTVTLPATTTASTTLTVILQYYSTSSYGNNKWVCVNYY
jgi:hypothetical protein